MWIGFFIFVVILGLGGPTGIGARSGGGVVGGSFACVVVVCVCVWGGGGGARAATATCELVVPPKHGQLWSWVGLAPHPRSPPARPPPSPALTLRSRQPGAGLWPQGRPLAGALQPPPALCS